MFDRSGGHLAWLLLVCLCVPSVSLPSRPKKAWEIGASGPVEEGVADLPEYELTLEDEQQPKTGGHKSRPRKVHTSGAHHGSKAGTDVGMAPALATTVAGSVSQDDRTNADRSSGDVLYQVNAGSAKAAGGITLTMLVVVVPIAFCCCLAFYLDSDDQDKGSGFLRDDGKGQAQRAPATAQMSPHPSPPMNQRQVQASPQASPLPPTRGRSPPRGTTGPSFSAPSLAVPGSYSGLPSTGIPPSPVMPSSNMALLPASTQQLFAPVVTKGSGEVFMLQGRVLNTMQASEDIKVTRADTGEPYARIHINENSFGCGVLLEMHPGIATAFFDTQFALGRQNMPPASRQVALLRAGPDGWDPTSEPAALVMPSAEMLDEVNVCMPGTGGAPPMPLLTVKLEADGNASTITPRVFTAGQGGARPKVGATFGMIDAHQPQSSRKLFVRCGVDPVLVLCSVVAAVKIGVHPPI